MHSQHIIVVGSGLVGATFMCAAACLGCRVTLLDKNVSIKDNDERPISLTYATVILLRNLCSWTSLSQQATPIRQVHISEQGGLGSLLLTADQCQRDALGYVVPYALLEKTLCEQVLSSDSVRHVTVDDIVTIDESNDTVNVTFLTPDGEQTLRGDYVIAADGVNSRCRTLLNIPVVETSRSDRAVTALMTCQRPHENRAYERFTKHGVFALLPMAHSHQVRLVWTVNDAYFSTLDDSAKIAIINEVFQTRIGNIASCQWQGHYPLKTIIATQQVTKRTVLLGDSAHRISPLAAQGYNLAVRDIAVLIDVLRDQKSLADYVAERKSDQQFTTRLTKGLEFIFGLQVPLLSCARSMGLLVADLLPGFKQRLIRQMTGQTGRQPQLLCEE